MPFLTIYEVPIVKLFVVHCGRERKEKHRKAGTLPKSKIIFSICQCYINGNTKFGVPNQSKVFSKEVPSKEVGFLSISHN